MSKAFIAKFTHSFFCLREIRHFLYCYPVVSVYRHLFIIEATQHVQSAVLAEQVLPPLRLVRTARRTNNLQARMNGCKPACSTIYPIRNGYLWIIKFSCCYWVAYRRDGRLRKVIQSADYCYDLAFVIDPAKAEMRRKVNKWSHHRILMGV